MIMPPYTHTHTHTHTHTTQDTHTQRQAGQRRAAPDLGSPITALGPGYVTSNEAAVPSEA